MFGKIKTLEKTIHNLSDRLNYVPSCDYIKNLEHQVYKQGKDIEWLMNMLVNLADLQGYRLISYPETEARQEWIKPKGAKNVRSN